MQSSDRDNPGSGKPDPWYSLIRSQTTNGFTRGRDGSLQRHRPVGTSCRQEIEDVINNIKWTQQDRWILQSWRRAVLDVQLRHQYVNRSDQDRSRGWCRMNPRDREEIAGLIVELIGSDREVQAALLDWACRAPHRTRWD